MAITSLFGSDFDLGDYNNSGTPLQSYNFVLVVEGIFDIPCKSVRAFKKENEFELIQEGGVNDYVHMRRKPISKPFQFQVERYLGTDKFDIMSLGTDFILPLILCVSRWQKPSEANSSRFYIFMGATVIEKEYSTLDSEKSGLHTETITIAYKELFAMNQNFINTDGDELENGVQMGTEWEFDKNATNRAGVSTEAAKKGKNQHARKSAGAKASTDAEGNTVYTYGYGKDYSELTREDFEKRAKKWKFNTSAADSSKAGNSSEAAKKGSGKQSAQYKIYNTGTSTEKDKDGKDQKSYGAGLGFQEEKQSDFVEKAKLWAFNQKAESKAMKSVPDAKKGTGTQSAVQPVGILTKTGGKPDEPETYGFGPEYTEATRSHLESRAHLWTFNTEAKNQATATTADAKKGKGTQSAQHTYAHNGTKTTTGKDGKQEITYGSGQDFTELTRDAMKDKAKLWAFKSGVNSKAGLSTEDAKKGDGTSSAVKAIGKAKGDVEELQGVWSGRAEKNHLWKFNKDATNKAGISVPDAKKGGGNASAVAAPGKGENDAELTRSDYEGKSKLWKFAKDADSKAGLSSESAKKGGGTTSAQHSFTATSEDGKSVGFGYEYTEDTQETMAGKASQWKFNESIKKPGAKGRLAGLSSADAKKGNEKFHRPQDEPDANKVPQDDFQKKADENLWKFSGKAAAGAGTRHLPTDEPEANKKSKETMAGKASMWDFNENANSKAGLSSPDAKKGNDKQHVSTNIPDANKKLQADFEGKSSLWEFQDKAKNGNGTLHVSQSPPTANTKSKEDFAGKAALWPAKKSAVYKEGGQDPEARLWPDQSSAAKREGGQDPEARLWPDQSSAVKREGGQKPEERLWPQQKSAVYREGGKDPEERLWPKQKSAVYKTDGKDPEARLWPKQKSAVYKEGGQNPEERLWPKQKSAVYKEGGQKAEERLWPKQKSAVYKTDGKKAEERLWPKQSSAKYQKKGQDPQPRLYPQVKSAVYYTKGRNEEPRRWPEKKSAVYITDILS